MTRQERVACTMAGGTPDRLPVLPIAHTALAPLLDVPLGRYFSSAETMAWVIVGGWQRFGYDGVQLSMGVTAEAEALGAEVVQPPNGSPLLKRTLLQRLADLDRLRDRDPVSGGRMPLFFEAVERVVAEIGREAFVLPTLRGPLLMASQLRGVEQVLIDTIDDPSGTAALLGFTTDVGLRLGQALLATGAHGLALGEATCSPNFISPRLYRQLVHPCHRRLVSGLKAAGWRAVGLHICGGTLPILEDVIATGVDFMDVDYQVPAGEAAARAAGRIALRGNLDPTTVLRFGTPDAVRRETRALRQAVAGTRWILSSGCDVPPGTPAGNVAAFVSAALEPLDR